MFGYSDALTAVLKRMRNQNVERFIEGRLLDIGCEKGELVRKYSGFGIDRNPRGGGGRLVKFELGNNMPLPFLADTFDTVTMVGVIEHLDNTIFELKQIHRVLKKGGRLVITTPAPSSRWLIKAFSLLPFILDPSGIDHKCYYSKRALFDIFSQSGFTVIHYQTFQLGMNQVAVSKKQ